MSLHLIHSNEEICFLRPITRACVWGICLFLTVSATGAQSERSEKILSAVSAGIGANDLNDMSWDGRTLWVSGAGTLTRHVSNFGTVYDWRSYRQMNGFGKGSIYALASSGDTLVVSWGWTEEYNGQQAIMGDGLSLSRDGGDSWTHIPVTKLFPDRASFSNPGRYTATWDIAFTRNTIWCCSLSGFLLKSTDMGETWTNILPDAGPLDLLNANHHGQCLDAYGDTLWVGTFQGMNLSLNRGKTWTNYSWKTGEKIDLANPKPGNFVYAVEHKTVAGKTHVWAGCSDYYGLGMYGICHTADNGATWKYETTKYNAWNFAFGHKGASDPAVSDSTVFAASDSGLAVSYDLGATWDIMTIRDSDGATWRRGERISSVAVVADTLWATSANGIARTTDWGRTWTVYKGITRVKTLDTGERDVGVSSAFDDVETYAFPNPFTPSRRDADYSRTNIHYALKKDARISVTLFDFRGRKLRELVRNENRAGGRDHQEVWDGKDADGSVVPNGVYFYLIKTDKGDSARGKIMVLD